MFYKLHNFREIKKFDEILPISCEKYLSGRSLGFTEFEKVFFPLFSKITYLPTRIHTRRGEDGFYDHAIFYLKSLDIYRFV